MEENFGRDHKFRTGHVELNAATQHQVGMSSSQLDTRAYTMIDVWESLALGQPTHPFVWDLV